MEHIKNMKEEKKLRGMSVEDLESMKKDLNFQLIVAKTNASRFGMSPKIQTPTKLARDLKKEIARINTILNQKK